MEKVEKRKQDKYGRWYIQTENGRFYETIPTSRLIDGGFHTHGGSKHNRRDD